MNKVLITILIAVLVTQLTKLLLNFIEGRRKFWKFFLVTGGMPSGHSALVVSLLSIIYLIEGASTSFVISLVLAMIVLRDATGVRLSVGKEGDMIKKLIKKHHMKDKLKYSSGHTATEVLVGSIIGFVTAWFVYLI